MLEITEELVEILVKKSDPYPELWCLVFKIDQLIALISPGKSVWAGGSYTMVMGTERELRDLIEFLNLETSPGNNKKKK